MSFGTLFRAILRFSRKSTHRELTPTDVHFFLFPVQPVTSYHYYASCRVFVGNSTLGAAARKALLGYTVSKVTCFKERFLDEREYFLAEVRGFDDEQIGILRFERPPLRYFGNYHAPYTCSVSTSESKYEVIASDTALSVRGPSLFDKRLKTICFAHGLRPTLVDLYILLFIIRKHSEFYSVLQHQSYWFADTFTSVLESFYKPSSVKERKEWATLNKNQKNFVPDPANNVTTNSSESGWDLSQGTWQDIMISPPPGGDKGAAIEKLMSEFKKYREDFVVLVQEAEREAKEMEDIRKRTEGWLYAGKMRELAESEGRRADEQERLAKEEKKRADEQERLAKEEKKRADEGERRAEEDRRRADEEIVEMRRLLREQQGGGGR